MSPTSYLIPTESYLLSIQHELERERESLNWVLVAQVSQVVLSTRFYYWGQQDVQFQRSLLSVAVAGMREGEREWLKES